MEGCFTVISDGTTQGTVICDDEGREITNVQRVRIDLNAERNGRPVLTLDMVLFEAALVVPADRVQINWSIWQILRDRVRRWWSRVLIQHWSDVQPGARR